MKRNRRILSLLLAICLIAALIPAVATAESYASVEEVKDDQIVSFAGRNWVVMSNNAQGMVLLLETPEAPIAYNASGLSNDWDSSDAKAWCESEYVRGWFSNAEWNALSSDKVYFLSHDEVVTYYANNTLGDLMTNNGWWLRYNGEAVDSSLFCIAVSDAGFLGTPHVATNYGARPAIMIPAENIAMTQIQDGKWTLKVVDSSAFSGFSANVNVNDMTATVNYSGVASGKISVVLTDRIGQVLTYNSYDAGDSGTINHTLPADLMGWYTIRVFNEAENVTSAVTEHSFNIEDSHGEVVGYEATLKGDVSINFAIDLKNNVADDDGAYVVVTTNSGTEQIMVTELGKTERQGADASLLVNVAAPQMNDPISIQVFDRDGKGGAKQTFTLREYAESIINDDKIDNPFTKELLVQMLNYGAKAQVYFGYNSNDLANENVGVVEQAPVPEDKISPPEIGTVEGISLYGASLIMNSNNTLRFYFVVDENSDISTFAFTCNSRSLKATPRKVNGRQMYSVDVIDIAPDKLGDDFVVYVNNSKFVTYSPMAYIQRIHHNVNSDVSAKNLMQALYNYHSAAVAYVENLK